jgi:flagellar M-ring protein FliF
MLFQFGYIPHYLPSAPTHVLITWATNLESPQSYEKRLEYVQKLVDDDPKLVAHTTEGLDY